MNGTWEHLTALRGGDADQVRRQQEIARAHPEVQWGARVGLVHVAYIPLPHGGYTVGGESLRELLDKLDEYFADDEPDTG